MKNKFSDEEIQALWWVCNLGLFWAAIGFITLT